MRTCGAICGLRFIRIWIFVYDFQETLGKPENCCVVIESLADDMTLKKMEWYFAFGLVCTPGVATWRQTRKNSTFVSASCFMPSAKQNGERMLSVSSIVFFWFHGAAWMASENTWHHVQYSLRLALYEHAVHRNTVIHRGILISRLSIIRLDSELAWLDAKRRRNWPCYVNISQFPYR